MMKDLGKRTDCLCNWLFSGNQHGDAPIECAALSRGVVTYGMVFAIPFSDQAVWSDVHLFQLIDHAVGAVLGELDILCGVAGVVGVAADGEMHCGIGFEDCGDVVELFGGLWLQDG